MSAGSDSQTTPQGYRYRIRIMASGMSENGNVYPADVLRTAAPLFDGARVFVKSDGEHLKGQGKDFRNLIGRLSAPEYVSGTMPDTGEIQATLEIIDPKSEVGTKLKEACHRGMTDIFGFSIDALGRTEKGRSGTRQVRITRKIERVNSVDLIVEPSAGGGIINLIEAKEASMSEFLTQREVRLTINASNLPKAAQERLVEACADNHELSEGDLESLITRERDYLAKFSDSGKVTGLGETTSGYGSTRIVEGRSEKVSKMLDAFFDPEDASVISIRSCYIEATGDSRITGMVGNCDQTLLREALDSQSWGDVLGNAIARRLVDDYRDMGVYDVWKNLAIIAPVGDFRQQERTRFGGYGDLPTVAEGASYNPLTSPTDEVATYAVSKKGGTETLTLEMITNDDVSAVQQIPIKLSRAAKRTLCKFVLDNLRANPVIYDGKNLFHVDHGNLGADALSGASVAAGRLAMKGQAEKDSGERLGIGPRFLWVPDGLEEAAVDLFRRNTNQDKNFLQSLSLDVVPVWYWTDANDWCLSADPNDIPTVEVGFLHGRQEPELFIADDPRAGSFFTNDKITYKIRHIYGTTVLDYRGMYKSIVP